MTATRHSRSKELFLEACDLEHGARAAFLETACAGDLALRAEVEALLAADSDPARLVESADYGGGARMLAEALAARAPVPERIGGYRILRSIGEGGMGRVYEAEQESPRRRVALKVLRDATASPSRLRRFEHEAQLLGRLNHPGIAHVYAAGTHLAGEAGTPFIAMELIEGSPLDRYADSRRLGQRERLELLVAICDAVHHAHQNGVLHRDLKPSNILVDAAGRPRVLDFGVARLLEGEDQISAVTTGVGSVIGTLRYMSPEQVSGRSGELDARSDVYSLGVIAFELLVQRPPYELEGVALPQAARLICESEPPALGSLDRALRGDVETIVATALAKDRERRYASVAELAGDVRRWLRDEPIVARPASTLYHLGKFARRNTALVAGAALAALALIAGTITATWYARSEGRQRALADERAAQNQELRTAADRNAYRANVLAAGLALRNDNPRYARELLSQLPSDQPSWEHERLRRLTQQWVDEQDVPFRLPACLAFRPDGRSVVAAGRNGGLAVWDLDGGRISASLPDDPARTRCVALSRDGSLAVSILERSLRLWSTSNGSVLGAVELETKVDPYRANVAAFSPDGSRLAVAAPGLRTRVYELPFAGVPREYAGSTGAPVGLAFSGDGRRLAAVRDELPRVWSVEDGELVLELERMTFASSAALDTTGALLAIGGADDILVFDVDSGATAAVMRGHPDAVGSLAFDARGSRLAAMLGDGAVWIWNVGTGALESKAWVGRSSFRTALAWSPDETCLVTAAHTSPTLRLWDLQRTPRQEVLRGHTSYVYPVVYTYDGERLVSGSWDRTIRVWDAGNGAELRVLSEHTQRITALAAAPRSSRVAAVSADGALIVWDVNSGQALARAALRQHWSSLAWSGDGRTIAAGASQAPGQIVLFDAESLAIEATLPGHARGVSSLAFDPGGGWLISGGADGRLKRWELATRLLAVERERVPQVNWVCWSRDGRRLAVAGASGYLELCDPTTLATTRKFVGHPREVFGAAFAPDATRLFSGGRDGDLYVWDVESGALVGQFEGHSDYVWSVAVHPGGRRVATGSGDHTVHQWESEPMRATYLRAR